jgi:hypothetical protein
MMISRIGEPKSRSSRFRPGQMPNLASSVLDAKAAVVIAAWIRSLKE